MEPTHDESPKPVAPRRRRRRRVTHPIAKPVGVSLTLTAQHVIDGKAFPAGLTTIRWRRVTCQECGFAWMPQRTPGVCASPPEKDQQGNVTFKCKATLWKGEPWPVTEIHRLADLLRAREQEFDIRLSLRHSVNGQVYGPGTVRVPRYLAETLLENEGRAIRIEWEFQHIAKAGLIYGQGKHRIVPMETFDAAAGQQEVFGETLPRGQYADLVQVPAGIVSAINRG